MARPARPAARAARLLLALAAVAHAAAAVPDAPPEFCTDKIRASTNWGVATAAYQARRARRRRGGWVSRGGVGRGREADAARISHVSGARASATHARAAHRPAARAQIEGAWNVSRTPSVWDVFAQVPGARTCGCARAPGAAAPPARRGDETGATLNCRTSHKRTHTHYQATSKAMPRATSPATTTTATRRTLSSWRTWG